MTAPMRPKEDRRAGPKAEHIANALHGWIAIASEFSKEQLMGGQGAVRATPSRCCRDRSRNPNSRSWPPPFFHTMKFMEAKFMEAKFMEAKFMESALLTVSLEMTQAARRRLWKPAMRSFFRILLTLSALSCLPPLIL
ncbi:hypothetical protein AB3480_14260 [Rhizobium mongolense]|uniref:hypothetical protein n=1 Tax=Rhizobium mongolense TaxID=57676 RepID=UPI0034A20A5F